MPITINDTYKKAAALLSWSAYLGDDAHPIDQKKCIFNGLKNIPNTANGPYKLLWGPASKDGFLAFIALSTVDGSLAVGCRGTLSDRDPLGFVTNIIADTGFFIAEPWMYPEISIQGTTGYYTVGMQFAFDSIISATDPEKHTTMLQFLQGLGNGLEILVTGHSLGGALANLVAVYLADKLPATVAPFTFAAPTVTNTTWATDIFAKLIKTSYQLVNNLDIVPKVYWIDTFLEIELTYDHPDERLIYYEDGVVAVSIAAAIGALRAEQYYFGDKYNYTPVFGRETFDGKLAAAAPYTWPEEAYRQHSLAGSYFPAVGLDAPKDDGPCEKLQMGIGRPEGLPGVGKHGMVVKNTKGVKLRIVNVEK